MKNKYLVAVVLLLIIAIKGNTQIKIGNNPTTLGTSSLLELESTTKGLVLPRMSGVQMNTISNPVAGMFIYNTDSSCICQYTGLDWRSLCGGNIGSPYNDWHILGNAGTVDGTNFLGTTDNIPFNIRVNNQKSGRIDHLIKNTFFGYQSGNSNNGTNNSFFGYRAGYSNTTGSYNTFAGDSAGYSNTTGVWNTAMGYQSLGANTTGSYNTAYGYQSLRANTTGILNSAIGYKSLMSMTTGTDNSGVGLKSLMSNTTGNNNVAVGNHAIEGNITGSNNSAVGYGTLLGNTSGGSNSVLGYQVMYASTAGSNNIGIGERALYFNNADNNVAVGYTAGYNNTTGTGNSFFGHNAGGSNTTGVNNINIGYSSGNTNTTGNNITLIGTSSDVSANGFTNATAIGYSAVVGASNSLVLGGTGGNAVKVGIGTSTPSEALDVVGNVKFSGALMPNNNAGTSNNFLKSNGSGVSPTWIQMDTGYISNFSTKVRPLLSAGAGISYNSSTGVITNTASSKTSYQAVIASPGSTNSSTVTMVGLAGTITPNSGTKVMIVISGDIAQSGNNGNSTVQIYYGTGSAPSNGSGVTGTASGGNINIKFSGTGSQIKYPFSTNAIITGLTPGTAYWMDLGTTNSGGNTVNINNVSISAIEL